MKKIIKNRISLIIAFVGVIGGVIWAIQSKFDMEPIILIIASFIEIIGYFIISDANIIDYPAANTKNEQNVNVHVNIGDTKIRKENSKSKSEGPNADRYAMINSMKPKYKILFIDDDKNFNIVKILKDSGWKNTKTVVDIKSIDIPVVADADIIFVDINGVGKLLNLEHQGLDLALMIKRKYNDKKVGIYSANPNSNSFHEVWDVIDFKLEKNALPLQFQSIVEGHSVEIFKAIK